jgi:type II secretory pathway pseudopilin PulG
MTQNSGQLKRSGLMSTRPIQRARMAFTLVEAMVATVLLGTLLVSLYAGMSAGLSYTAMVREELRATQVMLEKLEGIRLYNWDQINTPGFIPTQFTAFYLPNPTNPAMGSGVIYTGTLTIRPVQLDPPAPYADDLREVVVRVRWVGGGSGDGVVREREIRTLVSQYGLQNFIFSN